MASGRQGRVYQVYLLLPLTAQDRRSCSSTKRNSFGSTVQDHTDLHRRLRRRTINAPVVPTRRWGYHGQLHLCKIYDILRSRLFALNRTHITTRMGGVLCKAICAHVQHTLTRRRALSMHSLNALARRTRSAQLAEAGEARH